LVTEPTRWIWTAPSAGIALSAVTLLILRIGDSLYSLGYHFKSVYLLRELGLVFFWYKGQPHLA
jgi:hypothetical protein